MHHLTMKMKHQFTENRLLFKFNEAKAETIQPSGKAESIKSSPMKLARAAIETRAKKMKEGFLNNPDSFTKYPIISKAITLKLATMGVKREMTKSNLGGGEALQMVDEEKYKDDLNKAVDQITSALNKNDKTRMLFFKACVDLYVDLFVGKNKEKGQQVLRNLSKKIFKIDPSLSKMLPELKKKLRAKGKRKRRIG